MSAEQAAVTPEAFWEDLRFGADGLVPVVVQSEADGQVLMLAYADREAARRTALERRAWFWSRTRRQLWRKGDTSGHALDVVQVRWDCDADTLLYIVRPHGPACHTGAVSCFYRGESAGTDLPAWTAAAAPGEPDGTLGAALDALGAVVLERRRTMPAESYVADLLRAGPARGLQKVGEEAVEAVIAGMAAAAAPERRAEAVGEFADLFFHALVALQSLDIPPEEVAAELARRHRLRPHRP